MHHYLKKMLNIFFILLPQLLTAVDKGIQFAEHNHKDIFISFQGEKIEPIRYKQFDFRSAIKRVTL